jgi:hypothetical protein
VRTHYRTILTITILALTSVIPLRASENSGLPDAPSASQSQNAAASAHVSSKHYYQGASPAARGGHFGIERDVIDWRYSTLTGSMFAASVANAELTQRCIEQNTCSFVPSALSSRTAMYGIGIPADFAVAYLSYRMKRKHNSLWILPEALVTGANFYVAAHSWRRIR